MHSRPTTLTSLPVELLLAIAKCRTQPSYLYTLVQLCKFMNELVTPVMYGRLSFAQRELPSALRCLHTLAHTPRLARLVHSLHIARFSPYYRSMPTPQLAQLRADFVSALVGMTNLRHLSYEERFGFNADACVALAQVSSKLESLTIRIERTSENAETSVDEKLAGVQFHFPRLTKLQVNNFRYPDLAPFFEQLVADRGAHIQNLSLSASGEPAWGTMLFPHEVTWSALHTLDIKWAIIDQIPASHTQAIRSLQVHGCAASFAQPDSDNAKIDANAYPHVETLRCRAAALHCFLPAHPEIRRPVKALVLTRHLQQKDVVQALPLLQRSACVVTNLTLYLGTLDLDDFDFSEVGASLAGMRYIRLKIADLCNPDKFGKLGRGLFAHTPNLREFTISDRDAQCAVRCDAYINDREMQRALVLDWEKICPKLRRVGFTSKFGWAKNAESQSEGEAGGEESKRWAAVDAAA